MQDACHKAVSMFLIHIINMYNIASQVRSLYEINNVSEPHMPVCWLTVTASLKSEIRFILINIIILHVDGQSIYSCKIINRLSPYRCVNCHAS